MIRRIRLRDGLTVEIVVPDRVMTPFEREAFESILCGESAERWQARQDARRRVSEDDAGDFYRAPDAGG